MAYLDPDNIFQAPLYCRAVVSPASAAVRFSALEWGVTAPAQGDPRRSLSEPGCMSRVIGSLFGLAMKLRLADPRLETLVSSVIGMRARRR